MDTFDKSVVLNDLCWRYHTAGNEKAEQIAGEILNVLRPFILHSIYHLLPVKLDRKEQADDLCQHVLCRLLEALRERRSSGANAIDNLYLYASAVVRRAVIDEVCHRTPQHQMHLRLYYLANNRRGQDIFARWPAATVWLFGLRSWIGSPVKETPSYLHLLQDDTDFFQQGLHGKNPAVPGEVSLPELLQQLLLWIDTPLEEGWLITYLLRTLHHDIPEIVSFSDETEAEVILPPYWDSQSTCMDWSACWQLLCQQRKNVRSVILLARDPDELTILTGTLQPISLLARALEISEEEMRQLWKKLPLTDDEVAQRLGTTKSYIHKIRSIYLHRIQDTMLSSHQGRLDALSFPCR